MIDNFEIRTLIRIQIPIEGVRYLNIVIIMEQIEFTTIQQEI